jgi:putative transposase
MSTTRPHRKLVKHYHEPGDLHELTFSCYKQQPLLTNDEWRRQLARTIDAAGQEFEIDLAAFVFMPEHVHLLVVPNGHGPRIDEYLAHIKQPFSKWAKQHLIERSRLWLTGLRCRRGRARLAFGSGKKDPAMIAT